MRRTALVALGLATALALPACKDRGAPSAVIVESTTSRAAAGGDDPTTVAPDTDTTPAWGAAEPLIVVTVFEDFQCPYCRGMGALLDRVVRAWPDTVQVQFRHRPLGFHRLAVATSRAAAAAHRQGAFDRYHDLLFKRQRQWSRTTEGAPRADDAALRQDLVSYAGELGLDTERFAADLGVPGPAQTVTAELGAKGIADKIDQDRAKAVLLGSSGTPTLYINGELVKSRDFSNLAKMIRKELRAAHALRKEGLGWREVVAERVEANGGPKAVSLLLEDKPVTKAELGKAREKDKRSGPGITEQVWKVPVSPDDAVKGAKDALVTLVEFSDFECPFCTRVIPTLDKLVEEFPQDVRLVFKHLPLGFHKNARPAAIASECARRQGKFWEFHDLLFAKQREHGQAVYVGYARALGLDLAAFGACLTSPAAEKAVARGETLAQTVGVGGTPNVFINGRKATGARPLGEMRDVVKAELAKARKLSAKHGRGDALYAAIIASGKRETALDGPAHTLAYDGVARLGKADAPVKIAVYSDFECPFCKRIAAPLEELAKALPDDVALYFKHFPLGFHKNARPASIASLCANKQGKFWLYHDKLFATGALTGKDLREHAENMGLDMAAFDACLLDPTIAAQIDADMAEGRKVGVKGTPTVLVNGRVYNTRMGTRLGSFKRLVAQVKADL